MTAPAVDFGEAVRWMQDAGVYEYVLPFLLVFAIFFAILQKTNVLGDKAEKVNGVVAGIAGLLVIVQTNIVQTINMFLPRVSLAMIVMLMGIMLIVLFAGKEYRGFKDFGLGLGIIVVVTMLIFALSPNFGWNTAQWLSSTDRQRLFSIGIFLMILGVVYLILASGVKKDKTDKTDKKNWITALGDSLNKE